MYVIWETIFFLEIAIDIYLCEFLWVYNKSKSFMFIIQISSGKCPNGESQSMGKRIFGRIRSSGDSCWSGRQESSSPSCRRTLRFVKGLSINDVTQPRQYTIHNSLPQGVNSSHRPWEIGLVWLLGGLEKNSLF